MKKQKINYICSACGYVSLKWLGRCTECGEWNTFEEEIVTPDNPHSMRRATFGQSKAVKSAQRIKDIVVDGDVRMTTGLSEFDRVLGGGVVSGSLILVGGDPGVGKSTLLLQIADSLGKSGMKILYVSGEESLRQIKLRSERLGTVSDEVYLLSETNMDLIVAEMQNVNPDILIVDSIQTVFLPSSESTPGSVTQVREVTSLLMRIAKQNSIATFVIGHVTKTGNIAGPKILEHIVDTVLYFEGEKYSVYRLIRAVKNRFGSANEIGIFEMGARGLEEVTNPSKLFLTNRGKDIPGSVTCALIEGTRPVLVEVQALVSSSNFASPRRMAAGIENGKVAMLLAVLEKRTGLNLATLDTYVNIVGGLEIDEPAVDLGVVSAVASSFKNKSIESDIVVMGEVGLTGEVRPVSNSISRIQEAAKLGFGKAIVPVESMEGLKGIDGIKVIGAATLDEVFEYIF